MDSIVIECLEPGIEVQVNSILSLLATMDESSLSTYSALLNGRGNPVIQDARDKLVVPLFKCEGASEGWQ